MNVEAQRVKDGINMVFDTNVGWVSLLGDKVLVEEMSNESALKIILALSKCVTLDDQTIKLADQAHAVLNMEIEDWTRRKYGSGEESQGTGG